MSAANLKAISSRKKSNKPRLPRRVKTGIAGADTSRGFSYLYDYFRSDVDRKIILELNKDYVRENFSKEDAKAILEQPEWRFAYDNYAAAIYWINQGLTDQFPEKYADYQIRVKNYFTSLINASNDSSTSISASADNVVVPIAKKSPMDSLKEKVNSTIMYDIDRLQDEWIDNKKTELDLFKLCSEYDIKPGAGTNIIKSRLETMKLEYTDAIDNICEQAVEAFSHLKKVELKRRVSVIDKMLGDLDKLQNVVKQTRKPRVKKAVPLEKKIGKLRFLKNDDALNIQSINPGTIIGAKRLYVFNTKSRTLFEYISIDENGLDVKGTTITNVSSDVSRSTRLRKPEDFLKHILKLTPLQINKEWEKLTTKTTIDPTARISDDCILLKVFNK